MSIAIFLRLTSTRASINGRIEGWTRARFWKKWGRIPDSQDY